MSVSLKVVLHTKQYNDGTQAVMLQCISSTPISKIFKRRTLCRVLASQFDKAKGRIKEHPNELAYNALIAQAYSTAEKRLLEAQLFERPINPEQIIAVNAVEVSPTGLLLSHMKTYIDRRRMIGPPNTAEKYQGHMTKLAEYLGKDKAGRQKDVHMNEITEDWLLDWSMWLRENGSKSVNTIHRRMAFINTIFIDARKRGLTKNDPMAFLTFKEQRVRKTKLTKEQIAVLENLSLNGPQHDARNTFLLQFYAYGTRISDAPNWKKGDLKKFGDTWYIEFTSMKTGQLMSIRLNAKAKTLVSFYETRVKGPFLLPWLASFSNLPHLSAQSNETRLVNLIGSKTSMINLYLKQIALKAELTFKLTTHMARHSFANLADSRIADKRQISAALGHTKFATTEIYLSELSQNEVNDAMAVIWE